MKFNFSKKLIIIVFCFIAIGLVLFVSLFLKRERPKKESIVEITPEIEIESPKREVLGLSVDGREIESFTFGNGEKRLIFIGGIHGGYEWNTVLLAYELIDHLDAYPKLIPDNLTVTIIPSLNPDGVFKVIKKEGRFTVSDVPINSSQEVGRFNARAVDLNRNFDCKWKATSTWRSDQVSAGSKAFSEPESAALKKFVLETDPTGVVFWHSQASAVYASYCENKILKETRDMMNAYSYASGYKSYDSFDQYEITGDAGDWLASIGVPAISVELATHENIEWERNLAGVKALFDYYKN